MQNSGPTDFKMLSESGLYAPVPDGMEAVKLSTEGLSQDVAGELREVLQTIATFLSDESAGRWLFMRDPRFGAEVALDRNFLADLKGAGATWIDHDVIKLEQQQRRLAKMHAGRRR